MAYNRLMANKHFGEIGDIWKHLPLAEILAIEKPDEYWESHSGAATYPMSHSFARNYGIYYFRSNARKNPILGRSAYFKFLESLTEERRLHRYPGSPYVAMKTLGNVGRYHFCDIDGVSLVNIRETADNLKISDDRVINVARDGVPVLASSVLGTPVRECEKNFAFIDPYRPFVRSENKMNTLDLLSYLAGRGVKTVLWYGYDSDEYRQMLLAGLKKSLAAYKVDMTKVSLWCGDINLAAMNDATFDESPGLLGCGIVCANMSEKAVIACDGLGQELAKIYEKSKFPDGHSGELKYKTIEIE